MEVLTLLVSLFVMVSLASASPFGFGLFDYDSSEQSPTMNPNSTGVSPTECRDQDSLSSYFADLFEYLEQTFNPFYEEEKPPTTPATVTTTTLRPGQQG